VVFGKNQELWLLSKIKLHYKSICYIFLTDKNIKQDELDEAVAPSTQLLDSKTMQDQVKEEMKKTVKKKTFTLTN
jgi:hypothetical protein